jgi:Mrp family chromosome partitioning ATPase
MPHPLSHPPSPTSTLQDPSASRAAAVLAALSTIQDPDLGTDIVTCGFVKKLNTDAGGTTTPGAVSFTLELTTPACPVKETFRSQAVAAVSALPWVTSVDVAFSAQPLKEEGGGGGGGASSPTPTPGGRPGGLARVRHLIAVSSCKGGVGKSTVSVGLAWTLAQMGARVGLLDADVYGPSLPTMTAGTPLDGEGGGPPHEPGGAAPPAQRRRVLEMDPTTRALTPLSIAGVACVSFGWAGQGAAIMRGAMVSGLIEQLLTSPAWGDLDYLLVDFPPGTGDIQLTLLQAARFDAAVIVTTPQRLAYVDVAKGVRMFSRLGVPSAAVAENMAFFDAPDSGVRYRPFGSGAGGQVAADFGIPHVFSFPITAGISAAGDGGLPLVVSDPAGAVAATFMELGAAVVQEVAKAAGAPRARLESVAGGSVLLYWPRPVSAGGGQAATAPATAPHRLLPAAVRRVDASARAIDEWTGAPAAAEGVPDSLKVASLQPVGAYGAQLSWEDGASSLATWDQLDGLVAGGVGLLGAQEAAQEEAVV